MTENEIQQNIKMQIEKELNDYLAAPFEDIIYPKWFTESFIKVFMEINQAQVPYRYETIVSISNKIRTRQVESLSMFEAGLMSTLWMSVPPLVIEKDIDKFLIKRGWLESVMIKYEHLKMIKTEALQRKATTLYNNTRQTKSRLVTV